MIYRSLAQLCLCHHARNALVASVLTLALATSSYAQLDKNPVEFSNLLTTNTLNSSEVPQANNKPTQPIGYILPLQLIEDHSDKCGNNQQLDVQVQIPLAQPLASAIQPTSVHNSSSEPLTLTSTTSVDLNRLPLTFPPQSTMTLPLFLPPSIGELSNLQLVNSQGIVSIGGGHTLAIQLAKPYENLVARISSPGAHGQLNPFACFRVIDGQPIILEPILVQRQTTNGLPLTLTNPQTNNPLLNLILFQAAMTSGSKSINIKRSGRRQKKSPSRPWYAFFADGEIDCDDYDGYCGSQGPYTIGSRIIDENTGETVEIHVSPFGTAAGTGL